jgi:hypothetical protein
LDTESSNNVFTLPMANNTDSWIFHLERDRKLNISMYCSPSYKARLTNQTVEDFTALRLDHLFAQCVFWGPLWVWTPNKLMTTNLVSMEPVSVIGRDFILITHTKGQVISCVARLGHNTNNLTRTRTPVLELQMLQRPQNVVILSVKTFLDRSWKWGIESFIQPADIESFIQPADMDTYNVGTLGNIGLGQIH